jgi:syntaxin 7
VYLRQRSYDPSSNIIIISVNRQLNLDKAKESSKILSDLLKSELAQAVDAPEINQRERGARKQQLARFQKDFQEAMQSFQDTATAAATSMKRHAVPSSSGSDIGRSGATTKVGKGKVGGEGLDDPFLQRMQQVEFDSAMVEERDEAINDIAQSIMEVNETMRDLANIVDEQGKDIDQIEVNTTNAEDNTEKGVGFLTDAEKYQKGYRKWILVLVCIIVVAAGGAAGAYVGLKH